MIAASRNLAADDKTDIGADSWAMPISRLGPPSPMPRFRWQQPIPDKAAPPSRGLSPQERAGAFDWGKDSILPYCVFDDYDRSLGAGTMPVVTIENDRLAIAVAPHLGGRLLRMFDKRLGRDLVFHNPVFQPANLAALNAWFSGGIEWNGLIPGHTPFAVAPVFCVVVETARGPVLRLYEFDRIVEATWQIDLFLPRGDDRLFAHGRIVNAAPQAKQAYWWTNVAVPTGHRLRIFSAADYAIEHVLPGNELARFPFPDPDRFDGSYPENWTDAATSIFFRKPDARRRYIAALDKDGVGLAQTSTEALTGRKFFYFGTSPGGRHWMDYLAREGEGDYVEVQAGVTPTQNQRFELPARSALSWTEAYGALEAEPALAHASNYALAEDAVGRAVDARYPHDEVAEIDSFLVEVSQLPADRTLATGSPWGRRQEKLSRVALAVGLDFTTAHRPDFWDAIAAGQAVPPDLVSDLPEGFAVSDLWIDALEDHRQQHGGSWLHDLMLGIAALDRDDADAASQLFSASLAARPSWLGYRQRALVAGDDAAAERDYLAGWAMGDAPPDLAVEIVQFFLHADRIDALQAFVEQLPEAVAKHERIVLAKAVIAARLRDLNELERLLASQFATIREGETLSSDLWVALQEGRLAELLGRAPTAEELTARLSAHPVPAHLDFRMRTDKGAA